MWPTGSEVWADRRMASSGDLRALHRPRRVGVRTGEIRAEVVQGGIRSIARGRGRLAAVSDGGPRATHTSAGGVNWKGSDVNVFRARSSSVAFANDAFVAVGGAAKPSTAPIAWHGRSCPHRCAWNYRCLQRGGAVRRCQPARACHCEQRWTELDLGRGGHATLACRHSRAARLSRRSGLGFVGVRSYPDQPRRLDLDSATAP